MTSLNQTTLEQEVKRVGTIARAKASARYFKTGPGEYGAGDIFAGLTVPQCRALAKKYLPLDLKEIKKLLASPTHEVRLIGLLILVAQFKTGEEKLRTKIFNFYLTNLNRVNNWDLVDLSAPNIVGVHLLKRPKTILSKLVKSKSLWARRVSIIATLAFIRTGQLNETFKLAKLLLNDQHDLIHKAIGWMLREAGKQNEAALEQFLKQNYSALPRTTLRYAIERFPNTKRKKYLTGKF
jgi:3-methyladenine DNA glycosylase AlkD